MLTHATILHTNDGNRFGYIVSTFNGAQLVETVEADYGSRSTCSRHVRKQRDNLTDEGASVFTLPREQDDHDAFVVTLNGATIDSADELEWRDDAELSVELLSPAESASTDEFHRKEVMVENVTTNPAKIANAHIDKLDSTDDCDLVAAAGLQLRLHAGHPPDRRLVGHETAGV